MRIVGGNGDGKVERPALVETYIRVTGTMRRCHTIIQASLQLRQALTFVRVKDDLEAQKVCRVREIGLHGGREVEFGQV